MASKNQLYVGDNLDVLNGLNSESVDLIYLDPPFNSKRIYRAPIGTPAGEKGAGFHDIWAWNEDVDIRLEMFIDTHPRLLDYIGVVGAIHGLPMKAYLTFMAQRIIEMHRVLKTTGSLYLHCDPTASHYLKIILDEVFGKHNFRNEIVWAYNRFSRRGDAFPSMCDIIFFYGKSKEARINLPKTKAKDALRYEKGYHTVVDRGQKKLLVYDPDKAADKIAEAKKANIEITHTESKHPNMGNVWSDISILNPMAKERTGYPTQKPLALLDRIIKASSNEGDMVLDPFCGCATTCVAAQHLRRNWIGIDISDVAVELVRERLTYDSGKQKQVFTDFTAYSAPPMRSDIKLLKLSNPKVKARVKRELFGEQEGACKGCGKTVDFALFDLDHIRPKARSGADRRENLQLLCRGCNAYKGDRPMEYLLARLKARCIQAMF